MKADCRTSANKIASAGRPLPKNSDRQVYRQARLSLEHHASCLLHVGLDLVGLNREWYLAVVRARIQNLQFFVHTMFSSKLRKCERPFERPIMMAMVGLQRQKGRNLSAGIVACIFFARKQKQGVSCGRSGTAAMPGKLASRIQIGDCDVAVFTDNIKLLTY